MRVETPLTHYKGSAKLNLVKMRFFKLVSSMLKVHVLDSNTASYTVTFILHVENGNIETSRLSAACAIRSNQMA